MDLTLRPYSAPDAAATRRVFERAVRETAAAFYSREQVEAWCGAAHDEAAWQRARARSWTVVAEAAGEVVGFSDLTEAGELDMLFVSPAAGGRGVARLLVDAVLAEARARGLRRVTTRASRAARPAFERFGFVVDRANDDNTIRGVVVPNFSMHVDLG